ncbi:MAG: DUF6445 family protein [Sphingopyxis sp.]|nr:DUF6445 family protein [Sphingopyxis sp.]
MTRQMVETIGAEAQPLVILDDFASDPDALRRNAIAADLAPALNHYPGVRAALPPSYLDSQLPVIAVAAAEAFGRTGQITVVDASFSIVATAAEALSIPQRLPHIDAFTADRIALVHYLSPGGGDGTAFYRHRATGFETVDDARRELFFRHLDTEIRLGGPPPPGYVLGDTPLFECVRSVPARYNRALLYRSWNLHSGAIGADTSLTDDPATGRLTVTAFLSIG